MKRFFIKGFDKRYSIGSDGVIISHYRNNNKGERYYRDSVMTHYQQNNSTMCTLISPDGKNKRVKTKRIMADSFNIVPPDNVNMYDLININGDIFDNSKENIGHKIRTTSHYNHVPKSYVNGKNKTTHKVCGDCGEKQEIENFSVSGEYKGKKTFKNVCKSCMYKRQWEAIKKDPNRFEKHIKRTKEWAKSEEGRKYYNEYDKKYRKSLKPSYLKQIIKSKGFNYDVLDDVSKEIIKAQVLIRRECKTQQ